MKNLARATYLLKVNTNVLRFAQLKHNSHVEEEGRSLFGFDFQYYYNSYFVLLKILVKKDPF